MEGLAVFGRFIKGEVGVPIVGAINATAVAGGFELMMGDTAAAWKKQDEWQPKVFGSEDAKEGATAFIEKRDPVWQGR